MKKKNCENSKLVYPRFLGYFYSPGTMNVPCTRQQESIRNWRTFCEHIISHLETRWSSAPGILRQKFISYLENGVFQILQYLAFYKIVFP